MKRTNHGVGHRTVAISPVRMLLDDVQDLQTHLPEGESFRVRTLGYEFDDLAEFAESAAGRKLSRVDLIADSVRVEIRSHGCEVSGSADLVTVVAAALGQSIPPMSRGLTRPQRFMVRWMLTGIGFLGMILVAPQLFQNPSLNWLGLVLMFMTFLGLSPVFGDRPVFGGSQVTVSTAIAYVPFWEKHGDDIRKSAVSALIGSIVGGLIGYFIRGG